MCLLCNLKAIVHMADAQHCTTLHGMARERELMCLGRGGREGENKAHLFGLISSSFTPHEHNTRLLEPKAPCSWSLK